MKVPKLRFRADDGSEFPEWEEKRLGELGEFIGGGTPPTKVKEYWKGTIPWISSSDVFENDIRQLSVSRFITEEAIEKSAAKRISENSICIVCRVGVGKVVITPFELCTSQDFVSITALKDDICFLGYAIWNLMQRKILDVRGTSIKGIPVKDLREYMIDVPSLPEQQKIASFLSTIDEIITTTQSELTAWEERKKGVMQKIFNREVRFKADDGSDFPEWEEKRLGDVTSRVTRRNNNIISDIPLTISGVYGLIDQRKYFNKIVAASDLSNYYLLKNGEFAYNRSSSVGYDFGAIKRLDSCECGAVSTLYICFSILDENNIYSDYLRVYFDSNIWNKYAASVCAEGARNHGLLNISVNDFFDMPVCIPSFPEQKKIANCLSSLDDVINQIQAELSAWKEFKKGLLQQMFV